MPRNQVIVKFPTLNNKGGDLNKKWYVEYYYRVPGEVEPRKRRISEGLCKGSAEERYANAKRIIETVTGWLKDPKLFTEHPDEKVKILRDERTTSPEADRYNEYENAIKIENLTSDYLLFIKDAVAQKTYETYKSKLRYFATWIKESGNNVLQITQQDILPFFRWLSDTRQLTKRSIGKYKQILHSFYDWLIKRNLVWDNPINDIPNYGRIIDCAPSVIDKPDIERLKSVIQKQDPYLWLACEIQYYCAIRPGQELRLLKVGDIHIDSLTITIRQENAKNRHKETVPITQHLADSIKKMGIMNYDKSMYVFGAYNIPSNKPVGKNTLRNRFNKFRDDLGIDKSVKFYSWKHTGAISMVNNGVSVWELQHHMRHSSITTTEEYIRQRAGQSRKAKEYIDEL